MAYFSNGSEGMVFDDECAECAANGKGCPIAMVHVFYNYDQVGNDVATKILDGLVRQAKGEYRGCQMKPIIDSLLGDKP